MVGCWYLRHSGYVAGERAAEARMQALIDEVNQQAIATEKTARARVDSLEKDHVAKVSELDDRYRSALYRAPVIRVCAQSTGGGEVSVPTSNAGHDPGNADGSGHAEADGNIAPQLILYGRDAEQLRLAVEACKAYGAEIERFRAESR